MSLLLFGVQQGVDGFPRVSGDEPVSAPEMTVMMLFSPRERG